MATDTRTDSIVLFGGQLGPELPTSTWILLYQPGAK